MIYPLLEDENDNNPFNNFWNKLHRSYLNVGLQNLIHSWMWMMDENYMPKKI